MSAMIIKSREANDLKLTAYHGHFATRHSHNSHYLDITRMKHECAMANIARRLSCNHYVYEKEIRYGRLPGQQRGHGTFLARQLSQKNLLSLSSEKISASSHRSTIQRTSIFRIIFAPWCLKECPAADLTVNSGRTAACARGASSIEAPRRGSQLSSARLKQVGDIPVISLFSPEDIPGYVTSLVKDCPMCKAGQKIDVCPIATVFSLT